MNSLLIIVEAEPTLDGRSMSPLPRDLLDDDSEDTWGALEVTVLSLGI